MTQNKTISLNYGIAGLQESKSDFMFILRAVFLTVFFLCFPKNYLYYKLKITSNNVYFT